MDNSSYQNLNKLLIANRGEIACRLIRTAKKKGVVTVAVYSSSESTAQHVADADEAYSLDGDARTSYLDGDQIIAIAKTCGAQAIIPGYGFLSENAAFARAVKAAGLVFVGPEPHVIEAFALKHKARQLAIKAKVPVVPGSDGLLESEDAAVEAATRLGSYPVIVKAAAGGGGMGLFVCHNQDELRSKFHTAQSRGSALFGDSGVILERYVSNGRHIEVQIFGNGVRDAIFLGERECSIQRRHQKIIEECPSPYVEQRPELRDRLRKAAVKLTAGYTYAGTVEFIVEESTGDFFFLEMNTRLQVEHGITELCRGVDIVEAMLDLADASLACPVEADAKLDYGLSAAMVQAENKSQGHAIQVRLYAENPNRDFAPSPGLLQSVSWYQPPGSRIDSWVKAGTVMTSDYDALLAKVMFHGATRELAIGGIDEILNRSSVYGPCTNIDFVKAIVQSDAFVRGETTIRFVDSFEFRSCGIDIRSGGSYTLVQDYPGRPGVGHGYGQAGPMDPIAFQVANILVGNAMGTEGLEITLVGPDMIFLSDALIALCGPPVPAKIDGDDFELWTRLLVRAGQRLTIGKLPAHCRVYLAIHGGFLNVAQWLGSKATNPSITMGGYQGRSLRDGDFLQTVQASRIPQVKTLTMPHRLRPVYRNSWTLQVMAGPYETGFLTPQDINTISQASWEVSHNSARAGIRLLGPRPEFARSDGGSGGSHPSNVVEYGYPVGGISWTGDESVILPVDSPNFGGFICTSTVVQADMWKLGQLRAGDALVIRKISLDSALEQRRRHDAFLNALVAAVAAESWEEAIGFDGETLGSPSMGAGQDIIQLDDARLDNNDARDGACPRVTYRTAGDNGLLVVYGDGDFNLNYKCRNTALMRLLQSNDCPYWLQESIVDLVSCSSSLLIRYNGLKLPRDHLVTYLCQAEHQLGDMAKLRLPNRRFRLPVTFDHPKLTHLVQRYQINQRSIASYLPDPFAFVAQANGLTTTQLKDLILSLESVVIGVGFIMALPLCLPVDPRHRLRSPKMNPSRTHTPAGTLGWGGSCLCCYPVDSPGGYMPLAMTVPGPDVFGPQPWLCDDMDVLTFYQVSTAEYDGLLVKLKTGEYSIEVQDSLFDLGEHNRLLEETRAQVEAIEQKRSESQQAMAEQEKKLLAQWLAAKEAERPKVDYEELMSNPLIHGIDSQLEFVEAPMNANVWKIMVESGQRLKRGQLLAILEAMKMEININLDSHLDGCTLVDVLAQPGDSVDGGKPIMLVRRPRNAAS
ncbi:hypothetical protein CDD82_5590 [Ophiocordyceps australis]|uniref:Urea carboxylase n=1 Tax=Ophiocordyceps australis TaxID=1399860 RepID=A0A2C5ZRV6_9HYPO|nr:hypothetical protein CDD82_5590 [Ophiocordyceps australis]